MAVHQSGYNFHPNDRVWYFDKKVSALKEGTCYQVEIKIYKKQNAPIESKLIYLIALDDSPTTLRVKESDLYISSDNGLIQQPSNSIYHVTYGFNPEEPVWVVDRKNNGVRYGTVYQTELKIHKDIDLSSHAKILYYVSYNDTSGTCIAKEDDVFDNAEAAWASIGISIGPTPLPPDVTPLPNTGNLVTVSRVNGDNQTLYKGQPVYIDQSTGKVARVKNDATILAFLGFVYDDSIPVGGSGRIITEGTINNESTNWNNIIDGGGTLIAGTRYYISSVAGHISSAPPVSGYSKQIGLAASETEMDIRLGPTIKL